MKGMSCESHRSGLIKKYCRVIKFFHAGVDSAVATLFHRQLAQIWHRENISFRKHAVTLQESWTAVIESSSSYWLLRPVHINGRTRHLSGVMPWKPSYYNLRTENCLSVWSDTSWAALCLFLLMEVPYICRNRISGRRSMYVKVNTLNQ